MIKNLSVLLLILLAIPSFGQERGEAPDLKKIRKAVTDESSALYYPLLLQRFNRGDSTMTLSEKRHLYYGYVEQKDYSPYGSSDFQDSIRTILKNDVLIESDYVRLLTFTDSVLKTNPFDLRTLNYRVFAARKMGNATLATATRAKIGLLLDAMLSTGDGKSIPSAIWVLEVSHEYFLINALGLEYGGMQSLVDGPCDYLTLKENKGGLKGIYFNVSIGFEKLSDMLQDVNPGKKKKKQKK